MFKIAVCGGIGTGKSEVMKILASKGYDVLSMDEINKELLSNSEYIDLIAGNFPDVVLDGVIDKKALKKVIFNDENKRLLLNNLSHNRIRNIFKQYNFNEKKYLFVEVPLIIESNMVGMFDKLWAVRSSKTVRVARIMKRDGVSKEFAKKIISIQNKEEMVYSIANVIIINNGDVDKLHIEVEKQLSLLPKF